MLARVMSTVLHGVEAIPVTVEVAIGGGLPAFTASPGRSARGPSGTVVPEGRSRSPIRAPDLVLLSDQRPRPASVADGAPGRRADELRQPGDDTTRRGVDTSGAQQIAQVGRVCTCHPGTASCRKGSVDMTSAQRMPE